ncbi:DNA topoisomerase I [Nitrincola tibetensis]|uniref:DNA topoisomerase I n=1 Tax=Nitrincola tibetensis TaxID=2219697 RepID=A0A364NKW6_9GAMM|nr:DNA topoisomerase I [Nitrincola tibetensis]RAU17736.1 DNA topoisomerase I [Nitrincola tibetensis]
MPSDNLIFLFLIAVLGLLALILNYVITTREEEKAAKSARMKWLKDQSEHTLNALSVLKEINCRSDIIDKLNQHALSLIEEIGILAPDSDLMTDISKIKDSTDRARPKPEAFTNDRAVRKAQIYIRFAEKLFREMVSKGKITASLAKSYQLELYWLNITLVADAHYTHAIDQIQKNDKLTALAHLKHAKAMLVRATVPKRQKQDRLDKVQAQLDLLQPRKDFGRGALADSMETYHEQKQRQL